jgi:hypothetical protein
MISAVISLFGVVRGLFVAGGLFARFFPWLATGFGAVFTGISSLGALLFGGFSLIGSMWAYIASYHFVELIRRFILIGFITVVFGYVINYALSNLLIFGGSSISTLFNQYINDIASFGPLGVNLLALLTKIGFFQDMGIFFTVMIYTLVSRVALRILFR